jgi:hypothetical protein
MLSNLGANKDHIQDVFQQYIDNIDELSYGEIPFKYLLCFLEAGIRDYKLLIYTILKTLENVTVTITNCEALSKDYIKPINDLQEFILEHRHDVYQPHHVAVYPNAEFYAKSIRLSIINYYQSLSNTSSVTTIEN